ncbi:MAG: hypothetical protein BWK76_17520, partial [Desulfobulbaceae bacterium A2]
LSGALDEPEPIPAATGEHEPLMREFDGHLDAFFGASTPESSNVPPLPPTEAQVPGDLPPALFGALDEPEPIPATTGEHEPLIREFDGHLDAFFGASTPEPPGVQSPPPAEAQVPGDLPPALSGALDEPEPIPAATGEHEPLMREFDGHLDAFFGASTPEPPGVPSPPPAEMQVPGDVPSALFDAEDTVEPAPALGTEEQPLQGELETRLDSFFSESTTEPALSSSPVPAKDSTGTEGVVGEEQPALFDAEELPGPVMGFVPTEAKVETLDLDARLDNFFGRSPSEEGVPAPPALTATAESVTPDQSPALADVLFPTEEAVSPAATEATEPLTWELKEHLDAFFGEPVSLAEADATIPTEEDVVEELIPSELSPALSDVAVPALDAVPNAGLEESESLPPDLKNHLEAFFSEAGQGETAEAAAPASEIEELIPEDDLSPALSDVAATGGENASPEALPWEMEGRLDAFFGDESTAMGVPRDIDSMTDVEPLFLDDTPEEETVSGDEVELLDLEFGSLGFESDQPEDLSTFFVGETDTELIRLGDGISTLDGPPSTELVRQWQTQTEHLLGQIPVYDERRMPLQLLDTVLAALPGSVQLSENSTTLLGTLGRSLSQVMTVGVQLGEDSVLMAQYFNWQKEVNRRLAKTGRQPS